MSDEVELFRVMAYEPDEETDVTLGFNLVINVDLMDAVGKEPYMKVVEQALAAMTQNFRSVELDAPAITVDVA